MRAAGGRDLRRLDLGVHAAARQLGFGSAAIASISAVTDSTTGTSFASGLAPAAPCRGRRYPTAGSTNPRSPWWRRGRRGGRCRRSGFRWWPRVVLVDDGHRAPFQELGDGRARVEIAAALLGVLQGHQDLSGADAVIAQHLDQIRASAIWPTAAAAWLSSSFRVPRGNLRRLRPSAIEPDETIRTSRPSRCSFAISAASAASHAVLTSPASESISSDEPTLTTMRRNFLRFGRAMGMRLCAERRDRLQRDEFR